MNTDYAGIFTALTTPFEDDKVHLEKFRENIQKYNTFELSGYVIGGSTGEFVFLNRRRMPVSGENCGRDGRSRAQTYRGHSPGVGARHDRLHAPGRRYGSPGSSHRAAALLSGSHESGCAAEVL